MAVNTVVKKIVVGTPVRRVTSGSFSLSTLSGVTTTGSTHNDILVYDSANEDYRNLSTLRILKVDQLTLDSDTISSTGDVNITSVSNMALTSTGNLVIQAGGNLDLNANLISSNRFKQTQLGAFNDSDLTTKIYVDGQVARNKDLVFSTDDDFRDSVSLYNAEDIKVIGGNSLSTKSQKIGSQYQLTIDLDSSGVVAGTYGSTTQIPILRVNEFGQIDSISEILVAGVNSFAFDSTNGQLSIGTADGGEFVVTTTLDPFDTTSLTEGSNLYYTQTRFDSAIQDVTTNILPRTSEAVDLGSNTKRFKDLYLSGNSIIMGSLIISDSAGVLVIKDTLGAKASIDLAGTTTSQLVEEFNLFYTQARVDSAFDVRLLTKSTTDLTEGTNLYYTDVRADSRAQLAIDALVGAAPGTLDTLNELAAALGDDADFSTTVTNSIATKLATSDFTTTFDTNLANQTSKDTLKTYFDSNLIADSSTAQIRSMFGAAGDIQYNQSLGQFSIDVQQVYSKINFDSDLDNALASSLNIEWNADSNYFDLHVNANLDSGQYGSASQVPVITVDRYGLIDSIGTVAVAGVSSTAMDSATGIFTINTADGQSFPRTLYDASILNNAGNKAGITWEVSGSDDEYRIAKDFVDSDLEVYTIREMLFSSSKLRIEVAQFTPGLTATGQTSLNWDQPATSFAVSVDNPTDFPTRYINSVSAIAETDAYVGTTIGLYNAGAQSSTPAGGVDWTQTFTFDSNTGAAVRDNSTTISGGTSIGTLTFNDDQGAPFATTAAFTTTWKTPNTRIEAQNLSGKTFLETYLSTTYAVTLTNMQSSSNYTHTITPTGGTVSSSSGSGTFTYTVPIHKDNASWLGNVRRLDLLTELRRPAGVATTAYAVTDSFADIAYYASFTYPSFWIFTAATGTPPTRADIINVTDFESNVTELANQTKTFAGTINNSAAVPKAFWFAVRSSVSQPTTFQSGASAALLSDVAYVSASVNLEPDAPPSGYIAEGYNLYGITLQPGNTYVSIN